MSSEMEKYKPAIKCNICGIDCTLFCGSCKLVSYCCIQHQKMDRKEHKLKCKIESATGTLTGRAQKQTQNIKIPSVMKGDLLSKLDCLCAFKFDLATNRMFPPTTMKSALVHETMPKLKDLTAISLNEIVKYVNKIHWDKILYGKIITTLFKSTSWQMIVEDINGDTCRLCLYNFGENKPFQKNSYIAIKAPYMKHALDDPCNPVMLRCDNKDGVELIENYEKWKMYSNNESSTDNISRVENHEYFHEKGNVSFKNGLFKNAIDSYTTALATATSDEQRKISLSNRSQCYLNIRAYTEALKDTEDVLLIDPIHIKTLLRKAKALLMLNKTDKLIDMINNDNNISDLNFFKEILTDAIRSESERKGNYNIESMIAKFRQQGSFLKEYHRDYVHSGISIEYSVTKSRTVITKQFLPSGTLVMACKAFHVSKKNKKSNELMKQLDEMLPKDRALFYSLSSGFDTSPLSIDVINHYIKTMNMVNDDSKLIDLKAYLSPDEINDSFRVEGIIDTNAFAVSTKIATNLLIKLERIKREQENKGLLSETEYRNMLSTYEEYTGIFILPSFLNHSCYPNVFWYTVGDFMFVHTTKDDSNLIS